jgi:hypothetical protein
LPHNGTADDHSVDADGSPAPYYAFGAVVAGVFVIIGLVFLIVYWIFKTSREAFEKRAALRRL